MESVLIVSNTTLVPPLLSDIFQSGIVARVASAASGNNARQKLLEEKYDLIVIDSPLPDENGSDLALDIAGADDSAVLIFTRPEYVWETTAVVEGGGVCVLSRQADPATVFQSVVILDNARKRYHRLLEENRKLHRQLDEMRLVGRAKCLLMEHRNLTEHDAHRFIEKKAMDTHQTKGMVAESIIGQFV